MCGEISSRDSNPQTAQLEHITDLPTDFQPRRHICSCQNGQTGQMD